MNSPPMSLPSPAPSSSSSHHPHTFSSMPPPALNRATSAASAMSATSGRDSKSSGQLSNGNPIPEEDHSTSQNTPQPHHQAAYQHSHPSQHPFLPAVTSSPPPHAPLYVPPPQHAMAPDPIHTFVREPGMTSPIGLTSPTGQWPSGANGWHGPAGQAGYPGPGQAYNRQLANGHLPGSSSQHHLPPNPLGTYSGRMSMPPLGTHGRPGSRQGESRDRRRDRDAREEREGDEEVITTIFVVGFPDDMLEREFQNIFTFSRGFEAATLKYPSGATRPREPAAALLAELQALAAAQGGELGENGFPAPLEEALAALQLSTASSSSTTPSAAISMTPSAPTGPVLGGPPYSSQSSRRQTIGFARFRTRADALAAREQLQGRKIDTLTGATLKAEMAKKNLHTKRTTSGEELVGLLLRSGRLAGLMGAGGTGTGPGAGVASGGGSSNLPNQPNGAGSVTEGPQPIPLQQQSTAIPPAYQPQSAKEAWDSWPSQQSSQPSSHESRSEDRLGQFGSSLNKAHYQPSNGLPNGGPGPSASELSHASASPPTSVTSPNNRPTDSKALLALAEEADEMEGWTVGGMSMGYDDYTPRRTTQPQSQPNHTGSYPGGGFISGQGRDLFGSSPPAGSDQMSDAGRSMGMMSSGPNAADQNPPINTLYVGNLPAISPPALPPNFLEESLRSLFQTCPGYKRMSFRQKINGPMCFVEFEDVHFAANCIQTLYGHTLSGLVKGGIRLSYSKNSLGQRGVNHSGPGGPGFGGSMTSMSLPGQGYNPSPNTAGPGSTFGSQLQGQGHSAPSGPNTAPVPISYGHNQHSTQPTPSGPPLSPNAQPFALPSTSPRSRYFANGPGASSGSVSVPVPVPSSKTDPNASFQAFQPSNSAGTTSGFSPVGSPIRTPGSFSWVSSGSGMNGNGGYGGFALGSLDGAASAWGSAATPQQN